MPNLYQSSPNVAANTSRSSLTVGVALTCATTLLMLCGMAHAQSQITPSLPSIPLTPAALASGVQSRITSQYGIEFVTIGDVNNAPWPGNGQSNDRAAGKGSVDHEYRIGRFEVTTAQWAQFLSAAAARPSSEAIPFVGRAFTWGGTVDPSYTGPGTRYIARPGSEMRPVGGITWRNAAIYCNWLHNEQSTARSAFMSGAYDVSTFGYIGGSSVFSDQLTRSPGARFFLPSTSESVKAAHYDPNKNGPGQGGYWQYNITSDTAAVYAPPGVLVNGRLGQANSFATYFGTPFPGNSPITIPLGAYGSVQSPWGLLDTAGGMSEWQETAVLAYGTNPIGRQFDGSSWADGPGLAAVQDLISNISNDFPSYDDGNYGMRIAAAIPSTSSVGIFLLGFIVAGQRCRR